MYSSVASPHRNGKRNDVDWTFLDKRADQLESDEDWSSLNNFMDIIGEWLREDI